MDVLEEVGGGILTRFKVLDSKIVMIGYLSPLQAQAMAEWPALGTCV